MSCVLQPGMRYVGSQGWEASKSHETDRIANSRAMTTVSAEARLTETVRLHLQASTGFPCKGAPYAYWRKR
jgi:hypothetical protein